MAINIFLVLIAIGVCEHEIIIMFSECDEILNNKGQSELFTDWIDDNQIKEWISQVERMR